MSAWRSSWKSVAQTPTSYTHSTDNLFAQALLVRKQVRALQDEQAVLDGDLIEVVNPHWVYYLEESCL